MLQVHPCLAGGTWHPTVCHIQLVATATKTATTLPNDFGALAVLEHLDSHHDLDSTGGDPQTQVGDARKALSGLDFCA